MGKYKKGKLIFDVFAIIAACFAMYGMLAFILLFVKPDPATCERCATTQQALSRCEQDVKMSELVIKDQDKLIEELEQKQDLIEAIGRRVKSIEAWQRDYDERFARENGLQYVGEDDIVMEVGE